MEISGLKISLTAQGMEKAYAIKENLMVELH